MNRKCIVTITGPSACGKSTLEGKLAETGEFEKVVSTTTRAPRDGEVDGEDYHFVSDTSFALEREDGGFVECVYYSGNGYAVTKKELDRVFDQNKSVVIVCEPNGAKQIEQFAKAYGIPILQLYVTNTLSTLAGRFVRREMTDLNALDEGAVKYKIERLSALVEEHVNWPFAHRWDIEIERFDEFNQDMVINVIQNHVKQATVTAMNPLLAQSAQ